MNARTLLAFCSLIPALMLGACATTKTSPGPTISETVMGPSAAASAPIPGTTVLAQAEYVFAADLFDSARESDSSAKAARANRSGLALLDMRCNQYLEALGTANQAASNERKQVGIIGGFTSAIMGLTGSTAKAIAASATTFSFAGSTMDAFTNSFLFSDAAKSVTKLVRQAQGAYKTAAQSQTGEFDYPGAVSLLTGYEQVCRPAQIRGLIDEAVAAAKIVAEDPGALSADSAVITLLGNLTGALKKTVTESDGIALYAWLISDSSGRSAIKTNSTFVAALFPPETDATLEAKLSPVLAPLAIKGNPVASRWASSVALLKPVAKAAAAVPAVPAAPAVLAAPVTPVIAPPSTLPKTLSVPMLAVQIR